MTTPDTYPEALRAPLQRLHESLVHAIGLFTALAAAIEDGSYTRDAAIADLEDLTMNDGIDVFSTLADIAEHECETW